MGAWKTRKIEKKIGKLPKVKPLKLTLTGRLEEDSLRLADLLGQPADLVGQEVVWQGLQAGLFFLDGLVNQEELNRLLREGNKGSQTKSLSNLEEICQEALKGWAVLLIDGQAEACLLGVAQWEHRGPSEPETEAVLRGGREGFCEVLKTNLALVRRRLINRHLAVVYHYLGTESPAQVAVLYLKHKAPPHLIREIEEKMGKANLRGVWDSGMLENWLEYNPWSPFPQVLATERPDRVAAALAEGRGVLLVDGSPFAIIIPGLFTDFLYSAEDYYLKPLMATAIRWIRQLSFLIALSLPALYIALTTYHQEMVPTTLMLSIAAARSGVPMPAFAEAFLMEVSIELIREASIRLPGPMGSTLGIVGALVIGQSAVQAGLVGPILTVVVAITTLATFAIPNHSLVMTLRLLRFGVMAAAAVMGGFGLALALGLILAHILHLSVYGIAYSQGLFPPGWQAWDDHPLLLGREATGRGTPRFLSNNKEEEENG